MCQVRCGGGKIFRHRSCVSKRCDEEKKENSKNVQYLGSVPINMCHLNKIYISTGSHFSELKFLKNGLTVAPCHSRRMTEGDFCHLNVNANVVEK